VPDPGVVGRGHAGSGAAGGVSFDRAAGEYDVTRERFWQAEQTASAIERWLPSGLPVVEVGVGTALIAAQLRAHGWRVVGFDLSTRMLQKASQRMPGHLAVADVPRLPLRTGGVGGVYAVTSCTW
jgi:ubiquinone/menaquinone biosynthesis C-methylase UbiE